MSGRKKPENDHTSTCISLATTVGGISFQTCVYNASGPRTESSADLAKICDSEAGCVVTKSATLAPRSGNPLPRTWHSHDAAAACSLNSMGLPNEGIDYYLSTSTIEEAMASSEAKPYVVSICGDSLEDNLIMLRKVAKAPTSSRIAAVELPLSCRHVTGKPMIANDAEQMDAVLGAVDSLFRSEQIRVTLGIKLPPFIDVAHFEQAAAVLNKYKGLVSYVCCIDTIGNAFAVDADAEMPVICCNGGFAGLSGGPSVKYTALANVKRMRDLLTREIDVVGAGGIRTGTDAFEMLLCGASAVQVGTCHWTEGPSCFLRICNELRTLMGNKGYYNIEDFRGKLKPWSKEGAAKSQKAMNRISFLTPVEVMMGPFESALAEAITGLGGGCNFHAHLDRAGTLESQYLKDFDTNALENASTLSLPQKQVLTGELHRGVGYQDPANLEARMRECLDDCIRQGLRQVISCVDVTPDIGMSAMNVATKLREEYKGKISVKLLVHPIFGFKDDPNYSQTRWGIFKDACTGADVVGALPEKDDRPDSIGYDEHLRRTLLLAKELNKPFHAHVDQTNLPSENGTLTLIEAVRWLGSPKIVVNKSDCALGDEPTVWAIHAISPSSYSEEKFAQVLEGLVMHGIGVVVCPRAALSMLQHRKCRVPMHNCIARVLEMAAAGVEVRLGTDNLSDVFIPTYTSLLGELLLLADSLRFYDIPVLSKIASGRRLNETNRETIRQHFAVQHRNGLGTPFSVGGSVGGEEGAEEANAAGETGAQRPTVSNSLS